LVSVCSNPSCANAATRQESGQLERRSARDAAPRREWWKPSTAEAYVEYADASLEVMRRRDQVRESGVLSYRAVVRIVAKEQRIDPDNPAQFREDRNASKGQWTNWDRIIVPPLVTPTACVIALHELAHRAAGSDIPERIPEWLLELRAWSQALHIYASYHLPEFRVACHAAASRLVSSYVTSAVRRGETTIHEVLKLMPPDMHREVSAEQIGWLEAV
jgi:hypothetical protein